MTEQREREGFAVRFEAASECRLRTNVFDGNHWVNSYDVLIFGSELKRLIELIRVEPT